MRNATLDAARAAGIALMILDHVAVVYEWPPIIRDITRLAMPLFMVTSGYLFTGKLGERYLEVWLAAAITWPMVVVLELALVHVLIVYALVLPLLRAQPGTLLLLACLGLLQTYNWAIPWDGYQPGYLLAFLVLGQLARQAGIEIRHRDWPQWLTWPGRYPLTAYGVHLGLLVGLTQIPWMPG
ncbi:acyltransferase family protein [Halospina sp. K52047b]|uniref:acyltransferase family protein n=1 Tax=Halospina sp. K52047b TaxID=2614160 RepID=UPI001249EF3F|nr:acyltransferase family protein [Halospina sp. K52047b]KAA8976911.1 hypothetical protein F3089_15250 [Halospina sp. K52047b]